MRIAVSAWWSKTASVQLELQTLRVADFHPKRLRLPKRTVCEVARCVKVAGRLSIADQRYSFSISKKFLVKRAALSWIWISSENDPCVHDLILTEVVKKLVFLLYQNCNITIANHFFHSSFFGLVRLSHRRVMPFRVLPSTVPVQWCRLILTNRRWNRRTKILNFSLYF